jgi:ribosomal protein S18 acetylase RimI-like enzyme
MLGAAYLYGLRGRRTRADLLEHEDGTLAGALVRHRWTIGHCTAYPALIDVAAARTLGAMIERSSVTDIAGMESDTSPLRAHISRWHSVSRATPASLPSGFSWSDQATGVRRAVRSDLDHLVDVVWRYSPHAFPNRWLLRRRLTTAVDDLVLVLEIGDPPEAVGYGIRDGSTPEYDHWAQGVILPEHRGEGLAWKMVAAAAADASRRGVGGLVLVVESNPMPIPEDAVAPEAWTYVTLTRPRRVPGEPTARAVVDRVLALPARWQGEQSVELGSYRSPGTDDELVTNRRSQAWWQIRRSDG